MHEVEEKDDVSRLFLWPMLRKEVQKNNPHTLEELKAVTVRTGYKGDL
jgi:hypothetical protein